MIVDLRSYVHVLRWTQKKWSNIRNDWYIFRIHKTGGKEDREGAGTGFRDIKLRSYIIFIKLANVVHMHDNKLLLNCCLTGHCILWLVLYLLSSTAYIAQMVSSVRKFTQLQSICMPVLFNYCSTIRLQVIYVCINDSWECLNGRL